jgi:aspartate kinase
LFQKNHQSVLKIVISVFNEMDKFLKSNKENDYNFIYDQLVSYGEILSSIIISKYLNSIGLHSKWVDARSCIKTDEYYRDANVDFEKTSRSIKRKIEGKGLFISQGFIASDKKSFTTTLGREGSDYSAAIFAHALNAESVTIWKDVRGVLNADPRYFNKTKLLKKISYEEAIELAFYGASVIHPKTLQPLKKKKIPLYVKSFLTPSKAGTLISKQDLKIKNIPSHIVKWNRVLLKISSKDFSFIVEKKISLIFSMLSTYKIKVELIQNSAISFSVVLNNKYGGLDKLLDELKETFKVSVDKEVSLFTIRHFNRNSLNHIRKLNQNILLEQRTKETLQLVLSKKIKQENFLRFFER